MIIRLTLPARAHVRNRIVNACKIAGPKRLFMWDARMPQVFVAVPTRLVFPSTGHISPIQFHTGMLKLQLQCSRIDVSQIGYGTFISARSQIGYVCQIDCPAISQHSWL